MGDSKYLSPRAYHRRAVTLMRKILVHWKCSDCGASDNLHVHHKDGDIHNNSILNLDLLCPTCHEKYHNHGVGKK